MDPFAVQPPNNVLLLINGYIRMNILSDNNTQKNQKIPKLIVRICASLYYRVSWDDKHHHEKTEINGNIAKCLICTWGYRNVYVKGLYTDKSIETFIFRINKHGSLYFGMSLIISMTTQMGQDKSSYALASWNGNILCGDRNIVKCGKKLLIGDIIKIVLNNGTISFYVNDKKVDGKSFTLDNGISFKIGVSFDDENDEVEIL